MLHKRQQKSPITNMHIHSHTHMYVCVCMCVNIMHYYMFYVQ